MLCHYIKYNRIRPHLGNQHSVNASLEHVNPKLILSVGHATRKRQNVTQQPKMALEHVTQKDQTCPIHHAKITHYINNYCLYGSSLLFLHPLCLVFSCFCTCSCSCTQCFMELRPCSFDLSVNTSRRVTIRTCRHPSIQRGGLDFSWTFVQALFSWNAVPQIMPQVRCSGERDGVRKAHNFK